MHRSLIPFVLVIFGIFCVAIATTLPLLEWEVHVQTADFPATSRVNIAASPWTTYFAESLADPSTVLRRITVWDAQKLCINEEKTFGLTIARTEPASFSETLLLNLGRTTSWFIALGLLSLLPAAIYIGWVMLGLERRPLAEAVLTGLIGIGFLIIAVILLALAAPTPSTPPFSEPLGGTTTNCQGTFSLQISLLRIHYATPLVLLTGVVAALGAWGLILRQILSRAYAKN